MKLLYSVSLFNEQRLDGLMAEFKKEIRWFNNEAFNTSQKFFYESLFDRILNERYASPSD